MNFYFLRYTLLQGDGNSRWFKNFGANFSKFPVAELFVGQSSSYFQRQVAPISPVDSLMSESLKLTLTIHL